MGAQRWDWYALDPTWAARMVADAALPAAALVVDIGAGTGSITRGLLDASCRVIAVERHPRRVAQLRAELGDEAVVVCADAADLRLLRRPYHVVANPPFSLTSPILKRLLQPGSRLVTAHLIVQEAAARRWASVAAPGARRWSRTFETSLGRPVPRGAFTPRPRVNARVLDIRRR